jgi:hypothetical protein
VGRVSLKSSVKDSQGLGGRKEESGAKPCDLQRRERPESGME